MESNSALPVAVKGTRGASGGDPWRNDSDEDDDDEQEPLEEVGVCSCSCVDFIIGGVGGVGGVIVCGGVGVGGGGGGGGDGGDVVMTIENINAKYWRISLSR